jgi:S1-C subfamily serine protease
MSHVIVRLILCSAVLCVGSSKAFASGGLLGLRRAVFKIQVVSQSPDWSRPWLLMPGGTGNGSGFYIGNGRILTNAHVVAGASFITVQRDGDPTPVPARVIHIAHDADLALLEPADLSVFQGTTPLRLGGLPRLRSPVSTIGYPAGGDQISITDGVVSRLGWRTYVHTGAHQHLLIQVDSAINPGNSGGPVLQGRLVVGVAFQSFTAAENTGYIIPTPVVRRFLLDVEDGRYDGHPDDGLTWMRWSLANPATAKFHGLEGEQRRGVKITAVSPNGSTFGLIERGDVLISVNGQEIGVDGKVTFEGERVDFPTLIDLRQIGEEIQLGILRGGQKHMVPVRLKVRDPSYRTGFQHAARPRYTVFGGLVFTSLSRSWLRTFGNNWTRRAPLLPRWIDEWSDFAEEAAGREDLVILTARLPDAVNTWVREQIHGVVDRVDGVKVVSVRHLHELLQAAGGQWIEITFHGDVDSIVLDRAKAAAATPQINQRFSVEPPFWFHGPEFDGAISSFDGRQPRETTESGKPGGPP